MDGKGLRALSIATLVTLTAAVALIFFYAPIEEDQGIIQKIFYVHVPMAIVALGAMTLLFVTLWKLELTSKNASDQLRRLRRTLTTSASTERPTGAPSPPVSAAPARPVP